MSCLPRLLLAAALSFQLLATNTQAEARPDIAAVEARLGCQDHHADEAEGPMVLDFHYPHEKASKPLATAFWCQRDNPKALQGEDFLLVFIRAGKLYHPSCPPYLTVRSFFPRGIALSDQPLDLKGFYFLDEVEKYIAADMSDIRPLIKIHGPKAGHTDGLVFESGTSVENYFYCHKGRWLYESID